MQREMIIVPYDKTWKEKFESAKQNLFNIFGNLVIDIEHFGSTSIVGMSAKPIIDIMVFVSDINEVDNYNDRMKSLGYVPKGENGMKGRRYFQKFDDDGVNHVEHIHCYEKNNIHALEELMFRDFLKINQKAFDNYKAIKYEASKKYRYSPSEYTNYKTECINKIMKEAKLYYTK